MRTLITALVFSSSALAALAGSPDVPGQNGDFVNFAKDFWQSEAGFGHPNGWGQIVRAESQGTGPLGAGKLGQFIKNGPLTTDGKPDPSNDHGRGND